MRLLSFDAFRTLGLPGLHYLKPEHLFTERAAVDAADWVLFPAYWQVGALVFGMGARIFPSLPSYLLGHDKVEMTRAFTAVAPAHVPFTLIEPNTPERAEVVWDAMSLPFVAKLPRSSMGEGVYLIHDRAEWRAYLAAAPVIYAQEYLPIDRDLRVVWLGDRILTHYWRLQPEGGFHSNVARGGQVRPGPAPQAALDLVARLASTLGIDHAGFDIALVDGHPYVLEFNRLFGNQGLGEGVALNQAMLDWLRRSGGFEGPEQPDGRPPLLPLAV